MGSLTVAGGTRHEYPIRASQQMAYGVFGLLLIAATIPLGYLARIDAGGGRIPIATGMALLGFGAYLLAWALRTRLVIEGSQIRVCGVFGEQTFDRSDIEGWRTLSARYGSYRVLTVRGRRPIQLSRFATDDAFQQWFKAIPDLDERDRQALLGEIKRNDELGATPEERMAALGRAKAWNIGLLVVTVAATAGLLFGEAEWKLLCAAVLGLTPVGALLMLQQWPLLTTIFKPKKDPRADLSVALVIAGVGLMLSAEGVNLVSWQALLPWAGVVALVYIAGFYHAVHSNVRFGSALVGLLVLALFTSFGAAVSADILADNSAGRTYELRVVRKYVHVTSGRGQHTSYYLVTEPWRSENVPIERVQVPYREYRATDTGDRVCVGLHPGLLRAAWYATVPCQ